ncbi:type I restriction-modification system, M subunit [Salmonella enterica subsp. enterica]|nr:type I restriction-modification system, M subunit [Salmonella enterica subsp. enterica]
MRCDFIVLDKKASLVDKGNIDDILEHSLVLAEIKRDNKKADYVKDTQVKPLLDFAKNQSCIALYWDNIEQRIFWNVYSNSKRTVNEGPLALLPKFGLKVEVKALSLQDLMLPDSLLGTYALIEDILHQSAIDMEERYETILKLLLSKIYDEHFTAAKKNNEMVFQDYFLLGCSLKDGSDKLNKLLNDAVTYYERHLPKKISKKFNIRPDVLCECAKILAPIKITSSKRDIIQTFYMKFAKDLYRWDLAQYFTPPTVTDFIIDMLNPQFGEHLKDPACGSADFLVAAFHKGRSIDKNYADCLWGSDNSMNAVQAAVLNMLLNGDGKTNIKKEDSLENVNNSLDSYKIMVCNPPFGVKIVEKRAEILNRFDLGKLWEKDSKGDIVKTDKIVKSQETGLLFAELCVKQTSPKGRIAIIVPNGYLGNRSENYVFFREWLLRHCKIASICSFPRFTFKTSGADVSASVLFLEKRTEPLKRSTDSEEYFFHVGMIERVGWDLGNKVAAPVFKRNEDDGSYLISPDTGEQLIDSDFSSILTDFRNSLSADEMDWITEGITSKVCSAEGWSVSIKNVLDDDLKTLDPKRYCEKYVSLVDAIKQESHFYLTDALEIISQGINSLGERIKKEDSKVYKYIEIQDIGYGDYKYTEMKGWELPSRAKHHVEQGDIYLGSVWGSVTKWFMADSRLEDAIVTNGCYRLRPLSGESDKLIDIVAFLCTEAYAVQMRALARGSDGLAEVHETDLSKIVVPIVTDKKLRIEIKEYLNSLLDGRQTLSSAVQLWQSTNAISLPKVSKRHHHAVLV